MNLGLRLCIVLFFPWFIDSPRACGDGYDLPESIKVIPIGFVPQGERPITNADQKLFLKHLNWARDEYAKLLGGETFELAESKLIEVQGRKDLEFYRGQP